MPIEVVRAKHLGGGIRNDIITEMIDPSEAWDALNEDSSLNLGAASKRKGAYKVGEELGGPIRCIYEGKAWLKKRIVVAGSKMYDFTPPNTFTEVYDGIEGDKHDFVNIAPFYDALYGGIFVIMDGVGRPLWWDGIGAPEFLEENAYVAKCGAFHKSYFIMGNLTVPTSIVYDSEDQAIGSIATDNYSAITEVEVEYVSGTIVGVIAETSTASPDFDIHIFDTPPLGWKANETAAQHPMNSINHIFTQSTIETKGWRSTSLDAPFYTKNSTLYIGVYNDKSASDDNIKIRILYKPTFANAPQDIRWCPSTNIREWRLVDDNGDRTGAGRLSLFTREGGGIIKILPFSRDVVMVYKDDGSVVAVVATGDSLAPFTFRTLSEGLTIPSGNAILSWGDHHWIMSTEGFLKVNASGVEMVEPYGKARKIFESMGDRWSSSHGTVLEQDRKALIAYPRTVGEDKDGVLVYNMKSGVYDKWDNAMNVIGTCSLDSPGTIGTFAGIRVADLAGIQIGDLRLKMAIPEPYGGDYDGNVWRMGWVNRDEDDAIDGWRESGWIRASEEGKGWFRYIELVVDLVSDFSLTLEYRCDYSPTWHTLPTISLERGSSDLGSKVVRRYVDKVGDVIKVRWKNDTIYEHYTIRSLTFGVEPVGRGG